MNLARSLLLFIAAASCVIAPALAQAPFPTKLVTLVVPYTANSGSDIIARVVGPRWPRAGASR